MRQRFDIASQLLGRPPLVLLLTWVLVLLLLVVFPIAVTLARHPRFNASFDVIARGGHASPPQVAATVRRLIQDPNIAEASVEGTGLLIVRSQLPGRVTVARGERGAVVRVDGSTPEEAARIARALAAELASRPLSPRLTATSIRVFSFADSLDRRLDALPGPFPRRPSVVWVTLAGLCVGFLVCAGLWVLLRYAESRQRLGVAVGPSVHEDV